MMGTMVYIGLFIFSVSLVYVLAVRRAINALPKGRTTIGMRLFPPACGNVGGFDHEVTVELRIRVPGLSGEEIAKWSYVVLREGREMASGPLSANAQEGTP